MDKVIIVGGGLAGLISAILLQKGGKKVKLFEKRKYPFHRVCGEYVSNEALPFLKSLGIPVEAHSPSHINRLTVTSESGRKLEANLEMGGFGLSRYILDDLLFRHAQRIGVEFIFAKVNTIDFVAKHFEIRAEEDVHIADIALAAYGKRSNLDQKLKRDFFYRRSPYLGVKYHIRTDLAHNLIRLDNFKGGYSGVCKIEDDKFNLCYLSEAINLKQCSSIQIGRAHV